MTTFFVILICNLFGIVVAIGTLGYIVSESISDKVDELCKDMEEQVTKDLKEEAEKILKERKKNGKCLTCGEVYNKESPTLRAQICSNSFHCCRDCVWENQRVPETTFIALKLTILCDYHKSRESYGKTSDKGGPK